MKYYIVVLSESSSEAEFANTWFHEVFHAAVHIAEADGLGCNGEPVAYIGGYIAMRMQPQASLFMCSKCHKYEMQENYDSVDSSSGDSTGRLSG